MNTTLPVSGYINFTQPLVLDCNYVAQELFKEVGGRIGMFSWGIFIAVTWLLVSYRLKTRAEKGKSHLSSMNGGQLYDKTAQYVYIFLFMASFWLLVYGGFGV